MAAKTTLNEKNLAALGPERLAALVMEIVTGNAALKRQARTALLENAGGDALAAEVRKRLATIKRSTSFVDWDKRPALVKDLHQQRKLIAGKIATADPKTALELMWRFMELAEPVHNRADDSNGDIGDVFRAGCEDLGALATAAKPDPVKLADQAFAAAFDQNDYAQYDDLIDALTPALGEAGLARLKERALAAQKELAANKPEPKSGRKIGWGPGGAIYEGEFRHDSKVRTIQYLLQEIADAQGDVDAFIAGYDAKARTVPRIATEIAVRLLEAGRAKEALAALDKAKHRKRDRHSDLDDWIEPETDWVDARIAVLEALERAEEAQALRWRQFEETLSAPHLRTYLKQLPDFDDVEAEDLALDYARSYEDVHAALHFLTRWPDLNRAATLVLEHRDEWDGNRWYFLPDPAQALAGKHPLAATVLLRALILDTLTGAKSKRYKHAARHLMECASLAAMIEDYRRLPTHDAFITALRRDHPRKSGFWSLIPGDAR